MAIKELREDKNIRIIEADKGGAIVVMNECDHQKMVDYFLSSNTAFLSSNLNIEQYENKVNRSLVVLKEEGIITNGIYLKCRAKNSRMPVLKLLPKIHKAKENDFYKSRPIIDTRNSPITRLSSFLFSLLNTLMKDVDTNIKNSRTFVEFILQQKCHRLYSMASIDVKDLFTNLTEELISEAIIDNIDETILKNLFEINIQALIELIKVFISHQFFESSIGIYQQVKGCFMGAKLSMAVAEIVMRCWEKKFRHRMGASIKIYRRYIDDTFLVIPKRGIDRILKVANDIAPDLQFTLEVEGPNRSIPFLDCLVCIKDDLSFSTCVYRKEVYAPRIIHWNSYTDLQYKHNIIDIFTKRAIELSSDKKSLEEELIFLKVLFQFNGYPSFVINKRMKRILKHRRHNNIKQDRNNGKKIIYASIPYSPVKLKVLNRWLGSKGIKVVAGNDDKIKFNSDRENRDPLLQTNVVYQVQCQDCPIQYIGKTIQRVKTRLKQHSLDIENNKMSTKLAEHSILFNHSFDMENPTILKTCEDELKLLKWESLNIIKFKPINRDLSDKSVLAYL